MQRSGMRWSCRILAAVLAACVYGELRAQDASDQQIIDTINRHIRKGWEDNGVTPSPATADGEFARRVSLDIVGHIPSLDTLKPFLDSDAPQKRRQLVDELLDDTAYVRYWTNIWANLLIGRGNNQGNRQALERWLRQTINRNERYDQFVYELVAAEGTADENGAVGFLSAHLNEMAVPATAITSRIFLGMQVQCTQCHNHPFNDWKQSQFWGMNAFFRGTRRQGGGQRDPLELEDRPVTGLVFFERRNGLQEAVKRKFVDGTDAVIDEDAKPRTQLAKFMIDPEKPFLARTQVNRLWGHFLGYGFTRPIDDMGPHNPPSHPELLDYLAAEFTKSGYDNKRLIRWITASEAYQLSSALTEANAEDDPAAGNAPLFSRVYPKSFTAEQLYDSLLIATQADKAGRGEEAAENQRRQWLNQFIQTFGTDENDEATTFNGTIPQALVMMNGDLIRSAIGGGQGSFLRRLVDAQGANLDDDPPSKSKAKKPRPVAKKSAGPKPSALRLKIDALYLATLARTPTDAELEQINQVFQDGATADPIVGLQDLFWAILNSNEFIINH